MVEEIKYLPSFQQVKNYMVFYVVLEKHIEIHRIIYKKRNLSQLII